MPETQSFSKRIDNSLNTSFARSASLVSSAYVSDLNTDLPSSSSSATTQVDLPISIPGLSANPNPNPYLTSAAISPDFNGDGKADKIWVNTQTGEIRVRLMNGTVTQEEASLGTFDLSVWTYKIADFNSDGKTDFLLRNNATGEIAIMDGARVANFVYLDKVDPGWNASIGDFNGDRKTDIHWNNTQTGENAIWLMDGTTVVSANVLDTTTPGLTATIVDFDGNGKSDVFWRDTTTGANSVWFMDGIQATKYDLQAQDASWRFQR